MFQAAFYKSTRPDIAGMYNRLVRWWDRGPHSHCELQFSDGVSASSSFEDDGVRFKQIDFNPDHWDFIELPGHLEPAARAWFVAHEGEKYDLMGNVRFAFDFIPDDAKRSFCSEALGAALGILEPWRHGPNGLYSILKTFYGK